MWIEFEKWHGCKNDFLVVWMPPHSEVEFTALRRQSPRLCSRDGSGVGADGVIVLHQSQAQQLSPERLSIINRDGSLAKNCGNGIRCAALSVLKRHQEEGKYFEIPESVSFQLQDHEVTCRFISRTEIKAETKTLPLVSVEMGTIEVDEQSAIWSHVRAAVAQKAADFKGEVHAAQIGNDHLVLMSAVEIDRGQLHRWGPLLQESAQWDGINVHLVRERPATEQERQQIAQSIGTVVDEIYEVLPWERGVGATAACGSGACAVAAVILAQGFVEREGWIVIDMPGGRLFCQQKEADDPVVLAGPGEFVFSGRVEI